MSEPIDAEGEAMVKGIMDGLLKSMPLREFVQSQGAFRFKAWERRLAAHPEARAEFKAAALDEKGEPRI